MTLPVGSYLPPPFSAASPRENISNNADEGKFEFQPQTSSCVQLRRNQSRCYGDLKSIMSELVNETADLKTDLPQEACKNETPLTSSQDAAFSINWNKTPPMVT